MDSIKLFFMKWGVLIGGVGIILILGGFKLMAARVEILTLQRDQAVSATAIAEHSLEALRRVRAAELKAFEKQRSDNEDRQKFITENSRAIERARQNGDGPLAPVSVDTARRLRERYEAFNKAENRDP